MGAPVVDPNAKTYWYDDEKKLRYFYEKLRSQIEHEDGLCHQRMTWLIALQSFLFTGYGFSLSAQAVVDSSNTNQTFKDSFDVIISDTRFVMAATGVVVSLSIMIALMAAMRSIYRLVERWYLIPSTYRECFPQIIGNARGSIIQSMLYGQVPLLIFPVTAIALWAKFSINSGFKNIVGWGFVLISTTGLVFYTGMRFGMSNRVQRPDFKKEI